MYSERKLKYKNGAIKQILIICVFTVVCALLHSDKVMARDIVRKCSAEVRKVRLQSICQWGRVEKIQR